ncbi:hypothetical protein DSCO28_15780 [Desulfosarcina ovata subsp. sediminis]|uniref:TRAP C4-dicarboxylate transport system permease DctM subunit domain-containing protein n=1 Tax=Desulfosarcina ovata subsp. sediminis TaxID=885957 RepID=A0A5K7ZG07_9BACT|nr:TRAP transporter large permease [Desulfosarcina ovata]BBO81012.1 hypothetical protein DSCO28_15780 [Desulfosarcina ovata subsp. sediminis]
MNDMSLIISILFMLLLLFSGTPIAISLVTGGLTGLYLTFGESGLIAVAQTMTATMDSFLLLAVPLFILMGVILGKSEIGARIFKVFDVFLRHMPGGVAVATVITCAILSSMIGTSVAVAAMVASFALKNLSRYGYRTSVSLGILAAGGALGILIPPSVPMIVYAAISMESAGELFVSGILPGILLIVMFSIYLVVISATDQSTVKAAKASWHERWHALKEGIWALVIPFAVIIPLYLGMATPTEVAVIGVVWSLFVGCFVYRSIGLKDLLPIFSEGLNTSVMVLFVICGAMVFGNAVTQLGLPELIMDSTTGFSGAFYFIGATILIMLILGMFVEGASILLICLPLFLPTLIRLNVSLVWYAIIMVMSIEIALLTPPVGLNIYAVDGVAKAMGIDSTLNTAIRGTLPFMAIYLFMLVLVLLFPQLVLWLPSLMR